MRLILQLSQNLFNGMCDWYSYLNRPEIKICKLPNILYNSC